MRFLALEVLEAENIFLRKDYTSDYRASYVPADLHLDRLTMEKLQSAFKEIRAEMAIPLSTLHEIYTSIIDGKHILLYGPPGTGKTTLAKLVATKLFNCEARFETAVADWTPFETIGGLQLRSLEGKESLEPVPGIIIEAIVECLNRIAGRVFNGGGSQGVWLVLDELNRANMDSAFGPIFTALDERHPDVSLPFFDEARRHLVVPRRFRIVATMNTYDKNFLFRLSYALTRRFALIPVDVPANEDTDGRNEERAKLWQDAQRALKERKLWNASAQELEKKYNDDLMKLLYDDLITQIRSQSTDHPGGLSRSVGFAQIAAALRHAMIELELGLVKPEAALEALDRGVRSAIVPQLEGLSNTALQDFLVWWVKQEHLKGMQESIAAVRQLMRGAGLFVTE